ncbi:3'-5' exonuclease [Rhabdochlamydiaceae symbiont of Dictyostelium giganteum]|uniref:3'-5' exonuclease n=1 Tax=Rhabdochlamydiaceae symbiont of Dictyostelium giganteum TaxID=3342349 RepID=UPI00384A712A
MRGIFLDTETNGLNFFIHKVLEIAFKIVDLSTGDVLDQYSTIIKHPLNIWELSDPDSLEVNGFTYEMMMQGILPAKASLEITQLLQKNRIHRDNAVFICQNPSFDRVFFSQLIDPSIQENFKWPYYWLDMASMYWTLAIQAGAFNAAQLPWKTGFSKNKIAAVYHLPPEENPHRAMNGVDHLLLCYQKVVGFSA